MLDKITNLLLYFGISFIGAYGVWYSFTHTNGSLIALLVMVSLMAVGRITTAKDKVLANLLDLYSSVFSFIFLEKTVTIETWELKYIMVFAGLSLISIIERQFFSRSTASLVMFWVSILSVAGLIIKYVFNYVDKDFILVFVSISIFIVCHIIERYSSVKEYSTMGDFFYGVLFLIISSNALTSSLLGGGTLFFNISILFLLVTFIVVFNNVKFSLILFSLYFLGCSFVDIYQLSNLGLVQGILISGIILIALSLSLKQLKRFPQLLERINNSLPEFIQDMRLGDNYGFILESIKKK